MEQKQLGYLSIFFQFYLIKLQSYNDKGYRRAILVIILQLISYFMLF